MEIYDGYVLIAAWIVSMAATVIFIYSYDFLNVLLAGCCNGYVTWRFYCTLKKERIADKSKEKKCSRIKKDQSDAQVK